MPILKKEPDIYPENLLDAGATDPPEKAWFVMYTLARQEKKLMRQLHTDHIFHYGPVIANRTRSPQGRIRVSFVPVFTGYVFVLATENERYDVVSSGCVSRCIPVTNPEEFRNDLRRIRHMLETGTDVRVETTPVVGRRAIIRRGAMVGLTGTVSKVDNHHRLTVLVNFMQQGASVQIDEADVEFT